MFDSLVCSNCDEAIEAGYNDDYLTAQQHQGKDLNSILCAGCHEDTHCRSCGEPSDDGEGYDGLCGNCADRVENAHPNATSWMG